MAAEWTQDGLADDPKYQKGFRDAREAAARVIEQEAGRIHRLHAAKVTGDSTLNEAARLDSYAARIRALANPGE